MDFAKLFELFKNFCTVFVIIQFVTVAALIIIVAIGDKVSSDAGPGVHTGKHTLCALTDTPCIYKDDGPNACDDCPAAQRYFYQEEKNVDKVRGIQDEGRAD